MALTTATYNTIVLSIILCDLSISFEYLDYSNSYRDKRPLFPGQVATPAMSCGCRKSRAISLSASRGERAATLGITHSSFAGLFRKRPRPIQNLQYAVFECAEGGWASLFVDSVHSRSDPNTCLAKVAGGRRLVL